MNRLLFLLSTGLRLTSGAGVFIFLSFVAGPEVLGKLFVAFGWAGLLVMATEFGLANPLFKELIEKHPKNHGVYHRSVAFRLLNFAVAAPLMALLLLALSGRLEDLSIFVALALSGYFGAQSETQILVLRAAGFVKAEALVVLAGSVVHLVTIVGPAFFDRDPLLIATMFALSRLCYLAIAAVACRREGLASFRPAPPRRRHFQLQGRHLLRWRYYLVDATLTQTINFVDAVILGFLLTAVQLGVYQLSMKVMVVFLAISQMYFALFVPKAVRAAGDPTHRSAVKTRLLLEMAGIAVAVAGLLVFGGPYLTCIMERNYGALDVLWIPLGATMVIRSVCAAHGIWSVAMGDVQGRIHSQAAVIGIYLLTVWPLVHFFGLPGSVYALASAFAAGTAVYILRERSLSPS